MSDESRPPQPTTPARRSLRPRTGFLSGTDASLLGLGMQVASEVAAGVLLGIGADHLLGTERRWVVVGSLVGVAVAMWTLLRTAMRLSARDRARRQAAAGSATPPEGEAGKADRGPGGGNP